MTTAWMLLLSAVRVVNAQDENLIPVQEVSCGPITTNLTKRLVLEFESPEAVSWFTDDVDRLSALEEATLAGYNDLSFQSCDVPYFRTITSVQVNIMPSENNELLLTEQQQQNNSILILELNAECRNCTDGLSLFDVDESMTTITTTQTPSSSDAATVNTATAIAKRQQQHRQGSSDGFCVCPVPSAAEVQTLTTQDFLPLLNDNLQLDLEPPDDVNITVTSVVELKQVTCSTNVQQFTSFAFLEVNLAENQFPSALEIQALEASFAQTYNQLSFGSCDPFFRTVVNAKLELRVEELAENNSTLGNATMMRRQLQQQQDDNSDLLEDTTTNSTSPTRSQGNAVFRVQGECRDCPVTDTGSFTLFDDGFRRRRRRRTSQAKRQVLERTAMSFSPTIISDYHERSLQQLTAVSNLTTCACPAVTDAPEETDTASYNTTTSSATISQQDFLVSYNMELEELQEEGIVQVVQSVEDLEEGQTVQCGNLLQQFQSEVFSDLKIDLDTITPLEVQRLESAFQESYNQLTFRTCDGLFRKVDAVELRVATLNGNDATVRRLQVSTEAETFNTTANVTGLGEDTRIASTVFRVTGECRDCPVSDTGNFNLFDEAFRRRRRRRRAQEQVSLENDGTFLHGYGGRSYDGVVSVRQGSSNDVCTCLAGQQPSTDNGPTAEAFEETLTNEIVQLEQEGKLDSIEGTTTNLVEGTQVNCNGQLRDFTSFVAADLGVEARQLTEPVKERMEQVFQDTYNDLSFQACDQFFRVVSNVALIVGDDLKDQPQRRRLRQLQATNTSLTGGVFEVTGRCRNCPVDSTGSFALFDDAFRRSLLRINNSTIISTPKPTAVFNPIPSFLHPQQRRRMQEALDVCLCPQGTTPGEEPPPTTEEFLDEYNTNLVEAEEEANQQSGGASGNNQETIQLVAVQEVSPPPGIGTDSRTPLPAPAPGTPNPTNVQAAALAQGPTPQPTPQPTNNPTPQPTNNPTPQPTLPPTNQPTPIPTLPPTLPPTNQPTPSPTLPPTLPPTAQPTFNPTLPPTLTPTMSPTATPVAGPSSAPSMVPSMQPTAVCSQPFQRFDEVMTVTLSGNSQALNDTFLVDTLLTAAASIENTTGCVPAILTAEITSRTITQQLRRRLQSTTELIVFALLVLEIAQGDIFDPAYLQALLTIFSSLLADFGVVVEEIQGTSSPSLEPSSCPSMCPSMMPSTVPSSIPSDVPSAFPSAGPSFVPSICPSSQPSLLPSEIPSLTPSMCPSSQPSLLPSEMPSTLPSMDPSDVPSGDPSSRPSFLPSTLPSVEPSSTPSLQPSILPSVGPSFVPSLEPSLSPSSTPSTDPTFSPSTSPSNAPTESPTSASEIPTSSPTTEPPVVIDTLEPSSIGGNRNLAEGDSTTSSPTEEINFMPSRAPAKAPVRVPIRKSDRAEWLTLEAFYLRLEDSDTTTTSPTELFHDAPSTAPTSEPTEAPTVTEEPTVNATNAPVQRPDKSGTSSQGEQYHETGTAAPTDTVTLSPSSAGRDAVRVSKMGAKVAAVTLSPTEQMHLVPTPRIPTTIVTELDEESGDEAVSTMANNAAPRVSSGTLFVAISEQARWGWWKCLQVLGSMVLSESDALTVATERLEADKEISAFLPNANASTAVSA